MQRVPFLTQLGPHDVLIGRGAPSNVNEGNRRFRDLVMTRKDEYAAATRRQVKNQIAREIVDTVTNDRGGHFVRRIESLVEAEELGVPESVTAWAFVPLEMAVQKTKQALRDQALAATKEAESEATISSPTIRTSPSTSAVREANKRQKRAREGEGHRLASTGSIGDYLRSVRHSHHFDTAASAPIVSSISFSHPSVTREIMREDEHMIGQQQLFSNNPSSTLPPSAPVSDQLAHGFAFPYSLQPSSRLNRHPVTSAASAAAPQSLAMQRASALQHIRPLAMSTAQLASGMARAATLDPSLMRYGISGSVGTYERFLASTIASQHFAPETYAAAAGAGVEFPGRKAAAARTGIAAGGERVGEQTLPFSTQPESPSPEVRDESHGEAAVRVAIEIGTGIRPRHPRQEYMELTLLEMHILSVVCALGIPVFQSYAESQQQKPQGRVEHDPDYTTLTWHKVAGAVGHMAQNWRGSDPFDSPQAQPRQERNDVQVAALRQAQELETRTTELAKKVVVLLERVKVFGMSSGVAGRPPPIRPLNYEEWFGEELTRWFPLVREEVRSQLETKRPGKQHRRDAVMGLMDREDCRAVFAQTSCVSRLRSVYESASASSAPWARKVKEAATTCANLNKTWSGRPSWWDSAPSASFDEGDDDASPGVGAGVVGDDVVLLDMVLKEAVFSSSEGSPLLMTTKTSRNRASWLGMAVSLRALGIGKAAVQQRVSQLVEQLHEQEQ